jgi:hypothetical protein
MTSLPTPLLPSHYLRSRTVTPRSKIISALATSTMTTMAPAVKHAHDTSLVTLAQDFAHQISKHEEKYEKFSASFLKNKSLLVPTRLALKRQRAALKAPSLQYEPIQSETYQIELGNPDDIVTQDDYHRTISAEENRIKSTSTRLSPLRGDTPHTLPTDISLMYKYVEKS